MSDVPQDPTQISTRIRRAERALRREQERFGVIRDGAGTRDCEVMSRLSVIAFNRLRGRFAADMTVFRQHLRKGSPLIRIKVPPVRCFRLSWNR